MGALLRCLLRLYGLLFSSWLPPACRFFPSCSAYAHQAIFRYGALRGSWLTVCRLARCHPFSKGGYDPLP